MHKPKIEFPPIVEGPSAWVHSDVSQGKDWQIHLSEEQVLEIENAASQIKASGLELATMTKDDFLLPYLSESIVGWTHELLYGTGFIRIRGLRVHTKEIRHAATIFLGLGRHIGLPRSQNGKGHLLGHVCNLGFTSDDPNVRIYQTTERQNYHTDSCDVAALMCLKAAKHGGESGVVSSMSIYNEMLATCPGLLIELLQPMYVDRRGEITTDGLAYYRQPIYSWYKGYLSALYAPHYIRSAPRLSGVPNLSNSQIKALDIFGKLADDPRFNITFCLDPGDILFVHNHTVLHDRLAYEDWGPGEGRRHLLRLWLAVNGSRPLPDYYSHRFGSTTIGDRGGIRVPGAKLNVPLEPC